MKGRLSREKLASEINRIGSKARALEDKGTGQNDFLMDEIAKASNPVVLVYTGCFARFTGERAAWRACRLNGSDDKENHFDLLSGFEKVVRDIEENTDEWAVLKKDDVFARYYRISGNKAAAQGNVYADFISDLDLVLRGKVSIGRKTLKKDKTGKKYDSTVLCAYHNSIVLGNISDVRNFLEMGVPLDVRPDGENFLILAARKGRAPIVNLILDRGADINSRGPGGVTALICAIRAGLYNMAKLLIERGADVNASDDEGVTPLMELAHRGNVELVMILIHRKADVDAADRYGQTVLMHAVGIDSVEPLKALLEAGADYTKRDTGGGNVYLYADWHSRFMGRHEAKEILKQYGADKTVTQEEINAAIARTVYP